MKRFKTIRSVIAIACIAAGALFAQDGFDDLGDDLFGDGASSSSSGGSGVYTGEGSSSGNFDDSAIEDLFGKHPSEVETKAEPDKPARVLPPFHGDYKILIARPMLAVFEQEAKTRWVSAMGEAYAYYKVASFPRTQVFTMDQVDNVLKPNSRDYARRFNRQHFIAAAKKMGATHVLLQDYHPHKNGKEARYTMELYWIDEGAAVVKAVSDLTFGAFERGLDVCMDKVAEAIDPKAKSTGAYGTVFLGKDQKLLASFGDIMASEGSFTKERAVATYAAAEKIIRKNSGNLAVQYSAALLAGRAENYEAAINHLNVVISKSGDYPALQIYLAQFLRGAERYSEAIKAAETAGKKSALKRPAAVEVAMTYQAKGDLDRARSEYNAIMQSGVVDAQILFKLALLSIQSGNISESEDYLRQASESGLSLDESEYYELGLAYSKADGYDEKALEMLKRSLGAKQNNENAWEAIAAIHKKNGNTALEAETYVNLFKINMNAHSSKLRLAGEIYENLGMTDKAKDAYSLFLERKFANAEVSLNLARIYFNEDNNRNCARIGEILSNSRERIDTLPESKEMLEACGVKVRVSRGNVEKKKLSPLMLTLRISSGVAALGGLAGGIIIDQVVIKDLSDKYNDYGTMQNPKGTPAENPGEVRKMHDDIKSNQTLRNVLYGLAGVGLSGFAVTYFF